VGNRALRRVAVAQASSNQLFDVAAERYELKQTIRSSMLQCEQWRLAMAQEFSRVVEDVKQLSTAEKEELQELLKSYLIEERRREIEQNYEGSLEEVREGTLTFSGDSDTLRTVLSDD
jgi:hypothetical protein